MKISKKEEDFRIYVENDKGQYISSYEVVAAEKSIDKRITFRIRMHDKFNWTVDLTREEMKDLAELTNEVCKYL